jgi:hypothetical protein
LTKKPVPIDDLLTWAYRDELPKQEVGGLTGWEQAALLGVMVDQKEDRTDYELRGPGFAAGEAGISVSPWRRVVPPGRSLR